MRDIRIGTCSWADKTMARDWYPSGVGSPEQRLRYYATRFATVEVDSTYYALPSERNSRLWVDRTPDGFVFHVKAYGLMTGHSVPVSRLPQELAGHRFDVSSRGNVTSPSPELLRDTFRIFKQGIQPLKAAGRLGAILLQFPPYFTATSRDHRRRNHAFIRACRNHLAGHQVVVEFRHRSWLEGDALGETLEFLADHDLGHVCVDAPPVASPQVAPMVVAVTSSIAYLRLHGRNVETWQARTPTAADRFRYRYSACELRQLVDPVLALADRAQTTYVMFNNCYSDYAPRNALEFAELLLQHGG